MAAPGADLLSGAMSCRRGWLLLGILVMGAHGAACTKPNPAVCCIDAADCAAIDLPLSSRCEDGLACIDNQCVERGCQADAECTAAATPACLDEVCVPCRVDETDGTIGCDATAPVCDEVGMACAGCAGDDAACAGYADTPWCGDDGACVVCERDEHCANPTPVCGDDDTCRACEAGTECASGVCDLDTGACALPEQVVTVAVDGRGSVCTPAVPCSDLETATALLTNARPYLHVRPPAVAGDGLGGSLDFGLAAATSIHVYAEDALIQSGVEPGNQVSIDDGQTVTIRGLTLENFGGAMIGGGAEVTLIGVVLRSAIAGGGTGVSTSGTGTTVTLRGSTIERYATPLNLSNDSTIVVDRSTLRDGYNAAVVDGGSSLTLTNSIVDGTERVAIIIDGESSLRATMNTFVDVGRTATTQRLIQAKSVLLNLNQSVLGNLVWSPASDASVPMVGGDDTAFIVMGRSLVGPLVGDAPFGATVISAPEVVDYPGRDLHLAAGADAIDFFDTCDEADATLDFDGNPRTAGACDAGAFERQ